MAMQPVQHLLSRRPSGGVLLVGSNSLASIKRPQRTDARETLRHPLRVPTMESPLEVDRKEAIPSTVPMTDGSGQTMRSQLFDDSESTVDSPKKTVAKKAATKKANPKKANVRTTDAFDDDDF